VSSQGQVIRANGIFSGKSSHVSFFPLLMSNIVKSFRNII
jgi:hypothetical protein